MTKRDDLNIVWAVVILSERAKPFDSNSTIWILGLKLNNS